MHFLGSVIKHLLWSLLSIIVFLLLVGLAKTQRNINAYIDFLGTNDRSIFSWSHPATWGDPFLPKQTSTPIADMFSGTSSQSGTSGLDVYDPSFEQNLNEFSDASSGSTQDDFGFTTSGEASANTNISGSSNAQSTLLDLIKQREYTK